MPVDVAPRAGLTSAASGACRTANVAIHISRPASPPSHQPPRPGEDLWPNAGSPLKSAAPSAFVPSPSPRRRHAHTSSRPHPVKKARTEEVDPKREVNFRMPRRACEGGAGRNRGPRRDGPGDLEQAQGQRGGIHPPRPPERHQRARRGLELGADARRRLGQGVVGRHENARRQRQQVPHRGRDGETARLQEPLVRHQDHQLPAGALEQGAQTSTRSRSGTCSRTPPASSPADCQPTTRR